MQSDYYTRARARSPRMSLDLISTIESTSINRRQKRKTTANLARWRGDFIVSSEKVAGLARRVCRHGTGGGGGRG